MIIPQEALLEMFQYEDGFLYWNIRPLSHFNSQRACDISNGHHKEGSPAFSLGNHGYYVVQFAYKGEKKSMLMHRVIWTMFNGLIPDDLTIDHRDTVKTNCKIGNLRLATQEQNMMNSPTPITNTSGIKGVRWSKQAKKWHAYINSNNKQVHLGFYDDKDEAIKVVYLYRENLRKEFANHD